jgi:peptidoglycan hydrolase-like protein with peptidoglycan-binding domain
MGPLIGAGVVAVILVATLIALATHKKSSSSAKTTTPTSQPASFTSETVDTSPDTSISTIAPDTVAGGTAPATNPVDTVGGPTTTTAPVALMVGATGPEVTAMQQALHDRGFRLTPTGTFGAATARLLKQFQAGIGLRATGKLGPESRAALGLGAAGVTGFSTPHGAFAAAVKYLNGSTSVALPDDVVTALARLRSGSKGSPMQWGLTNEDYKSLPKYIRGRQVAQIQGPDPDSGLTRTLLLCMTRTKPITWCGVWSLTAGSTGS